MGEASQPRLTLRLDFDSGQPAYLQIVWQLARQAASGRLRQGQRLPAVRTLADQLGLNFNTVARAYRVLRRRGMISTQRGRGTYVLHKAPRSAASRQRALAELVRQYFDDARGHRFSDAEIAAALNAHLKGPGRRVDLSTRSSPGGPRGTGKQVSRET